MIPKRKFPGTDIEATVFGMGCMRLPTLDQENHPVDRQEAARMIHSAIERGVTYFDTAYGYHGGESERTVGEALKGGWREKITLTTKLPVWINTRTWSGCWTSNWASSRWTTWIFTCSTP